MSHTQLTLPLTSIVVEDRMRRDLGDIDELAQSISDNGLIQPVVVNQDKRLVAGGRRLAAMAKLGWVDIPITYKETMSERQLTILELEENLRRKEMTWKEHVACVAKVHLLKEREAALSGEEWTGRQTGAMLGVSKASVNFTIRVNEELANPNSGIHGCTGFTDAVKWCLRKRQDEADALLKRMVEKSMHQNRMVVGTQTETVPTLVPATGESGDLEPVTQYDRQVIDLSNMLIRTDCIEWLTKAEPGIVDHILTDPPYAIDMGMLNQNNPHGGMVDIDRIEETHQVDPNLDLLSKFVPLAYKVMKTNGFLIMFCDMMNWQFMYDLCKGVGFKVQRWPFIWRKTHQCMNQAVQFNMTKNYEIAIICRKPGTTYVKPRQSSFLDCSSDGYISNPFAKPRLMWDHLLDSISIPGQTILDPFAGEGSAIHSILGGWRKPIGLEIDEKHYNVMLTEVKQKCDVMFRNPIYV